MRRLLNPEAVAEKLGRSQDWFCRNRKDLYRAGFPRPIFGDRKHGRALYDEGAIDAWLDSKMEPALRAERAAKREVTGSAVKDWSSILEERLTKGGHA